jgi:hypothetical protein
VTQKRAHTPSVITHISTRVQRRLDLRVIIAHKLAALSSLMLLSGQQNIAPAHNTENAFEHFKGLGGGGKMMEMTAFCTPGKNAGTFHDGNEIWKRAKQSIYFRILNRPDKFSSTLTITCDEILKQYLHIMVCASRNKKQKKKAHWKFLNFKIICYYATFSIAQRGS